MEIKRWILPHTDPAPARELAAQTDYSEFLCRILYSRGCHTKEMVEAALGAGLGLDNPYLLQDMDKAVARVRQALEDGEKIAVYGDYDCDGITATALMTSYLQSVGADVFYYIPDREKEGYGLNKQAVETLAKQQVSLIITVDNGIASHEEIAYATSLGIDTVVTDHHTPRSSLPQAVAVLNPHRADCSSNFKELAGVGVAFKLVCGLEDEDGQELLEYYSDLVMLGTVADVVALTGENRTIVAHGLARLAESERPGLLALMELSGISPTNVTSEAVTFGMIPRLNAAGRMGCVDDAVELLLTDDVPYAQEMARQISQQNERRKQIETDIMAEIEGILGQNPQILNQRILILSGNGWCHGVVGIVAAKVVEKYAKPAILFSVEDGEARGSGRSVEGFSLIQAISACSEHLSRYGGHTLAAGLSLKSENLEAFSSQIQAYACEQFPVMPVVALEVDCALQPAELSLQVVTCLSPLEPFGARNRPPLFFLPSLTVQGIYPTGDKKHLRLRLCRGSDSFYAVFFRMSEQQFPYRVGDRVDVVANLGINEYNGKTQLSVRVKDLRLADVPQEEILTQREQYLRYLGGQCSFEDRIALVPQREDFACVYKFLRRYNGFSHGDMELYYRLLSSGIGYGRMRIALDVLEEMGLITRKRQGESVSIQIVPSAAKVDMENSQILTSLKIKQAI